MLEDPRPLCPSAQPEWHGSVAIGVVGGSVHEPRVALLASPLPVTEELLALAGPVAPAEVFRFAAPCMNGACAHFARGRCELAARVVRVLPVVAEELPPCQIRPRCRWWQQEGGAACARCPQVVTDNHRPSTAMQAAVGPAGRLR